MTRHDAPREGTKLAWLAQHASWTIEQLLAEGPFAGDNESLKRARFSLRSRYGIQTAALPTGRRGAALKTAVAAKSVTKTKSAKKPAAKTSAAAKKKTKHATTTKYPPATEMKLGQLRKLIFELGWDIAREVVEEFQQTHNRW